MQWILGSAWRDLGFFYLAPAVLVGLALFSSEWLWWPVLGFVVYQWLDVGHAFPTIFRIAPRWGTRWVYWYPLPVMIFVLVSLGFFFSFRWTLVAVVYVTTFHHIRQFYGISRWYQYLNRQSSIWSGRWLYILTGLPLLIVHFRPDIPSSQFAWAQLPHFDEPQVLFSLRLLLAAAWLGWGIFEFLRLHRYGPEVNRITSVFVPAALHYWCFTQATTIEAMLFPLLTVHALTYFFVVEKSLKSRLAGDGIGARRILLQLFAAGLVGGLLVYGIEALSEALVPGWLPSLLLSLALTPTLWHYIVDGFIWRRADLV